MDGFNGLTIKNDAIAETNFAGEKHEPIIAILGTGNYGRALGYRFQVAGLEYCIGSRNRKGFLSKDDVVSYEEAAIKSDVIFLAVPSHAYGSVIEPIKEQLKGKTVVDISNLEKKSDSSNAVRLQSMIPGSFVMKALNTVSAYTLENRGYGASKVTFVCGDDMEKKEKLMRILKEIGLIPEDKGQLSSAVNIERLPFNFFSEWMTAIGITIGLTILTWFYIYFRLFWYARSWKRFVDKLPVTFGNRLIAWVTIWLLCLTYLPGVIAGFIQILVGTKYRRFPNWLDKWMKCRKQLGLICLFLAFIHACMSCLLLASNEIEFMVEHINIPNTRLRITTGLNLIGQVSLLFSVLALALMSILGITSLPSVNTYMSWKEWNFIHSGLGFTSLIFSFIHIMVISFFEWRPGFWKYLSRNPKGIFPDGIFVLSLLPILVIGMKFVLMFPGISCYLGNIRKGKIGYKHIRSETV